ncbi:uncharacterized protein LOC126887076 [Diabrotica virgifera virgifera]|uniref:DDE Tnp4 domain-containing protein n=1 Tax=Diabrotica virgifera virgifera TaxID=50390 RepID=A0ABM5KJI4_DIAVI|nr:uncharacterized protein LOC126887076 [Diabrotica virgifera virgifera]
MSQTKFYELLRMLPFSKKYTPFREPVSWEERLALTLKFIGHVNSFTTLSFSYRLGYTTVRTIVYETLECIWENLQPVVLPNPSKEHWEKIERDFHEMWNFPNCCGALDGKHVVIEKPPRSGSLYFNYKHQHSIVLLALVDATYRFVTVDVGAYGRNSDGGIFNSSSLGKKLYSNELNFPPSKPLPNTNTVLPFVIVADAAFPLKDNIMRPYPSNEIANNEAYKVYDYRHSRARRVVENAFGLLTKKFKWYSTKYNILPRNIDKIILATVVLHNFLRNDKCSWQPEELEKEDFCFLRDLSHIGGRTPFSAERIREAFTEYFVSPNGSVPWQLERVYDGRR